MDTQTLKTTNKPTDSIQEIADWSGKKFGELRGWRVVDRDIRILSHTGGFAIFLPQEVWRKLDHQVSISIPDTQSSCWIADKNFAFLKIDTTPSQLEGSDKDCVDEDTEVALNKIESFVRRNFLENTQAYL